MSAIVSHHLTDHALLPAKARPGVGSRGAWSRIRPLLALWTTRIQDRRQLLRFSERELRDMRVSRWDVRHEAKKHFWQE